MQRIEVYIMAFLWIIAYTYIISRNDFAQIKHTGMALTFPGAQFGAASNRVFRRSTPSATTPLAIMCYPLHGDTPFAQQLSHVEDDATRIIVGPSELQYCMDYLVMDRDNIRTCTCKCTLQ